MISPVAGSTVQVPSLLTTADLPSAAMVLPAGAWVMTTVVGSMLFSGSVSLPTTATVVAIPTAVAVWVSSLATGGVAGATGTGG